MQNKSKKNEQPQDAGAARGKNTRVLGILKRLGAEAPVLIEDEEAAAPELTFAEGLSPSEAAKRAKFRRRYGAYTKPGPDAATAQPVPVAPPGPGFAGY